MTGSSATVVLVDPLLGAVFPAAALPAIRAASALYASGVELPAVSSSPAVDVLLGTESVVLFAGSLDDPAASALHAAGAEVIGTPRPAGSGLLDAVAVMDRLRSPGGCPWDAEQTHESLRQYLVEECFELLEAIEDGDRAALREELGDVLLQVLFHARVAQEDGDDPFTVDDVADVLVTKLVGRHPHVFAGGDPAVRDASSQERRWEELKRDEKRRESSVDGVAMGQPALALAAKLAQRTARVGLPGDLLPKHTDAGSRLFDLAALIKLAGADPEGELRAVARRFASDVRAAERTARDAGIDPSTMDHEDWRRFWPR
jgi:XTP/dITP diphosphohydrolase